MALVVVTGLVAAPLHAQQVQRLPLAPIPPKGEPVAPFFEGWFANEDGTFTLSFGYFNLNTEQVLDIPIGPQNRIEPGEYDGVQPTHFPVNPRRDRGVFHVTVPASYGDQEQRVVWTIEANGVEYSVPGRVGVPAMQLDYGPRAMGSVPPVVAFSEGGPVGQHVQGIWAEPRTVAVGETLPLSVWVEEVSVRAEDDFVNRVVAVEVTWFKHQGPADQVVFEPWQVEVESGRGEAVSSATFSAPGTYVLRARVDNWSANDSTGGDQCCWTNAFVPVTVTP